MPVAQRFGHGLDHANRMLVVVVVASVGLLHHGPQGRRRWLRSQVQRTVRTALGEPHRRGHMARNQAQLARPPRIETELVEPFTVVEAQLLLAAARDSRNGARWAIAPALGLRLRQGEALALRWDDIDVAAKTLRVRAARLRPVYEHDGGCGKTAGLCPQRCQRNGVTGANKLVRPVLHTAEDRGFELTISPEHTRAPGPRFTLKPGVKSMSVHRMTSL